MQKCWKQFTKHLRLYPTKEVNLFYVILEYWLGDIERWSSRLYSFLWWLSFAVDGACLIKSPPLFTPNRFISRTDHSETVTGVIFSFWNTLTRLPKLCCLSIYSCHKLWLVCHFWIKSRKVENCILGFSAFPRLPPNCTAPFEDWCRSYRRKYRI